jgi:hypothetical protein
VRFKFVVTLATTALLAACNGPFAGGSPTPTPSGTPRPHSTATLAILQPQPASVITTPSLHVEFKLTGGTIVAVTSKNLTPDTGHIHLSIDGRILQMNYQPSGDMPLEAFAAGPHLLQGEFVAVDHLPFNPRVIAKLVFDYEPSASTSASPSPS